MQKVTFDEEVCKGCGLCVKACPIGIVAIATDHINSKGYRPAQCTDQQKCTACASCARMCPDVAITVVR